MANKTSLRFNQTIALRCLKIFLFAVLSLGVGGVSLSQPALAEYHEGTWGPFPRVNPGDTGTCAQWARRLFCEWADTAATTWVSNCLAQARRVCERNNGVFSVIPLSGQTTTEEGTFSCKVTFKTDWKCVAKNPEEEGDAGEEETEWADEGYDWGSYLEEDLTDYTPEENPGVE